VYDNGESVEVTITLAVPPAHPIGVLVLVLATVAVKAPQGKGHEAKSPAP
jgi:hypothetical protein